MRDWWTHEQGATATEIQYCAGGRVGIGVVIIRVGVGAGVDIGADCPSAGTRSKGQGLTIDACNYFHKRVAMECYDDGTAVGKRGHYWYRSMISADLQTAFRVTVAVVLTWSQESKMKLSRKQLIVNLLRSWDIIRDSWYNLDCLHVIALIAESDDGLVITNSCSSVFSSDTGASIPHSISPSLFRKHMLAHVLALPSISAILNNQSNLRTGTQ